MILLVPVSRFSVPFEIGAGRPYSRLEELVCKMIMNSPQPVTLRDLRATFQVHDRLLIESVVTLVRAGWAAMNLGEGLTMTSQGRKALSKGGKPQGTVIRKSRTTLYMERVCGLIDHDKNSQLNVHNLYRLKSAGLSQSAIESMALPVRNRRNTLSIGQTQGLLPHRPGEWIRWIGEPTMQTKATEYVPVHVDVLTRTVSGLPRPWESLLADVVINEAEQRESDNDDLISEGRIPLEIRDHTDVNRPPTRRRGGPFALRPGTATLIRTVAKFEATVRDLINEAVESLLIAVPFVDSQSVRRWEPSIKAAIARGVQIDVLWGRNDVQRDGLAELKRIAATAASGHVRLLRYNIGAAEIVSQFIIADRDSAGHEVTVVVGGSALLGDEGEGIQTPSAVTLRSTTAAAQLARAAAGWWAQTPGEEYCAAVGRWRRLAAGWEQKSLTTFSSDAIEAAGGTAGTDLSASPQPTALILLDADCALLPTDGRPEEPGRTVVRGYSQFPTAHREMPPKGATAVVLNDAEQVRQA